jgi:hypothetical protein
MIMIIKKFKSKKNRVAFWFGKNMFGLIIGFEIYERFDWNHFTAGITFLWWYVTLDIRWRVANCGYPKGEVYQD